MKTKSNLFPTVLLISLLLTFSLTGCDKEKFFDQSISIPDDEWPADQEMVFKVNIEDTVSSYRFFINIRNSTSYRYSNIYFFLITEFPGGGMSRDTIECTLADKTGKWSGKGTGHYRDNRLYIRENIKFPRSGKYIFRLNQAMREQKLKGISEAGMRLEKQLVN
ncbi:MAG: gliding motility lipoprotein GldH [Lentimicrobiaceae bacterium]